LAFADPVGGPNQLDISHSTRAALRTGVNSRSRAADSCGGSNFGRPTVANVLEFGPAKAHIRAMKSHSPITVIVAVLIIVVAMAFLFRWHVVSSSIGLQRIDRWTGHIQICNLANGKIICVDE
jgi:hypothetical protein